MAQSHMCLDLMAPMPGVELDKPRVLMVEGSLNYKDSKTKVNLFFHTTEFDCFSLLIAISCICLPVH